MSLLGNLNIVAGEEKGAHDPFKAAKAKLVSNLETQLKCAEAMVAGEVHMVTRMETVEGENGEKSRLPVKRPARHWYWRDGEGKVRFAVRVLNKRIELAKDKHDILVGDDKGLPAIVKKVLEAAKNGELDEQVKKEVQERKKRKITK